MKKNLLVKLNDIIVDINSGHDKAVKKSVEFFLGRLVEMSEIADFRKKVCAVTSCDCINLFLNENGLFLRENAIMKKFSEYYAGKEFEGFISDVSLLIDKKKLKKMAETERLQLLSLMPREHTEFITSKLGMKEMCTIISSDSAAKGVSEAKKLIGNIIFVGNNATDYRAALDNNVDFIGVGIKNKEMADCRIVSRIDDILV